MPLTTGKTYVMSLRWDGASWVEDWHEVSASTGGIPLTPVPMSYISAPVKSIADAITSRNPNQPEFIASIITQDQLTDAISAKFNSPSGTSLQYIRGDGTLATLPSSQPLDSDLTAISELTTTGFGRSLSTQNDGASVRSAIGPEP